MIESAYTSALLTAADPGVRVIALRDLAVARLGVTLGVAWLFEPNPAIVGVEPAAVAWLSAALTPYAAAVLAAQTEPAAGTDMARMR